MITSSLWHPSRRPRKTHVKYWCFVDFHKAFDTMPQYFLVERLNALGLPPLVVSLVMALCETIVGNAYTRAGVTEDVHSIIGVKQGYPLSPTLFGI
jgi:hypothetical protein